MSTKPPADLSIVIVTFNRSQVLCETLTYLYSCQGFDEFDIEILIVDQTAEHAQSAQMKLETWEQNNQLRWIKLDEPHLSRAMNIGLVEASSNLILYVDDDIIPQPDLLLQHINTHRAKPDLSVVIGQVLQPGQSAVDIDYQTKFGKLKKDLDFPFNSTRGRFIENAIACNMSLKREDALAQGGFDEQFIPPVAARFETEFAKRLVARRHQIWFEPKASIKHLASPAGGTRALGSHLNSAQGFYGFGDYYYALRHGQGVDLFLYCLKRFFREVRTRYHLRHPWAIPVKWLGELRAFRQAKKAVQQPAKLLSQRSKQS